MFCPKCGKQVEDGTAYCPGCGAVLNAAPQQAAPIVVNVVNSNASTNTNTNTNAANGTPYAYKSRWTAFFLCLFFGGLGIHRFYVGKTGTGVLYLFTVGLFGIGWLIDFFMLLFGSFRDKAGYPLQ